MTGLQTHALLFGMLVFVCIHIHYCVQVPAQSDAGVRSLRSTELYFPFFHRYAIVKKATVGSHRWSLYRPHGVNWRSAHAVSTECLCMYGRERERQARL